MNTTARNRLTGTSTLLLVLSFIMGGCGSAEPLASSPTIQPAPTHGMDWPTQGWRTTTPEEQGMDSGQLTQMLVEVEQKDLDLHSLLVIRHGAIVSETYFGAYHADTPHVLYSVTKSFIATLVGIAIDRGLIDTVDHPVLDYFPDIAIKEPNPLRETMKLEHLLTMTTGLAWQDEDPIFGEMYRSQDWVAYVLNTPMLEKPGSRFNYCSGCSHVLSAIVQQTTGTNTRDFAQEALFGPLGITSYRWEVDSKGIPIGGWGLELTPRDMAKLGYLYLHQGEWDGQQIVSTQWIEKATQKHIDTDDDLDYGYQWWINPRLGAYMALGLYGQTVFVVPGSDLIVVTTAKLENHDEIFRLIETYILPAIQTSES
jgi:CubicO group peptidase (beta-lactamase class C family)